MSQIFSTEAGRETTLNSDGEGGYYLARIDKVTASTVPNLETIRDQVLGAWRDEQLAQKLRTLAEGLAARGRKGEPMKALGDGLGMAPLTGPGLQRGEENEVFSKEVTDGLFAAKPDGYVVGPVGAGKSFIVARLVRIDIANDAREAQLTPMFVERIRQSLASDIADGFTKAARNEQGVREPNEAKWKLIVDQN